MAYKPSAQERLTFNRLLVARTLSPGVYSRYRQRVDRLLRSPDAPRAISISGVRVPVVGWSLVRSRLFGLDYLTAEVARAEMRQWCSTADALAAVMTRSRIPALVIVPAGSKAGLVSILEHEFVHVNQFLSGDGPLTVRNASAREHLARFAELLRCEYEANFLQLFRWPSLYARSHGFSLDKWCTLRGYTAALEGFIRDVTSLDVAPQRAVTFAERLPSRLPKMFAAAGLDVAHVTWFQRDYRTHFEIALKNVAGGYRHAAVSRTFGEFATWCLAGESTE